MKKKWYNLFVSVEQPQGAQPAADGAPAPTAAETVAQIAQRLGEPRLPSATAQPVSFAEIYAAAEIPVPAHGFTIFKVAEMLGSDHIKDLPAGVRRSSVLVALEAAGVKVQEVVEDAVRRDRALDTYEQVQQAAVEAMERSKGEENARIQEELDRVAAEHRARIQANQEEVARARETLGAWRLQKQLEEQRIADAISYFVTENPVTTSAAPGGPPGAGTGQRRPEGM